MSWYSNRYAPYVPVAERRRKAEREAARMAKKGAPLQPVQIDGRAIAHSFWGKAWCDNLESYMDFANRLPRGRTYVRNGSVIHLDIRPGQIEAMVSGSSLYRVNVGIAAAAPTRWKRLCQECTGGIASLVELLQGRFSDHVMGILTRKGTGLFPAPAEIKLQCSCPDSATLCKHVAAVLYGVGARLDQSPELLFKLRSVDHEDLISAAAGATELAGQAASTTHELPESELGAVFGIELDTTPAATPSPLPKTKAKAPRKSAGPKKPKPRAKSKRPARRPS